MKTLLIAAAVALTFNLGACTAPSITSTARASAGGGHSGGGHTTTTDTAPAPETAQDVSDEIFGGGIPTHDINTVAVDATGSGPQAPGDTINAEGVTQDDLGPGPSEEPAGSVSDGAGSGATSGGNVAPGFD